MNDFPTALTYTSLMSKLEQGELAQAYCFFGEEDYLIEGAVRKIRETAMHAGADDFNWNVFRADADDMDWNLFADALTSLPLIPSRRVVVLKRLDRILRNKSAIQVLETVLSQPTPDLTLLLIQTDPPDLKKAFYKTIVKQAVLVAFPPLKPVELQKYLTDYTARFGKTLTPESRERILTESQPGLRELTSKLDILISYAGDKDTIDLQDVEACMAFTREVGVFNLLESLGRRDATSVRKIVEQLVQRRTDIGMLIPLLYRQLWAMYRMKYLQDTRVPNWKWRDYITVKPAFLEKRYRQYLSHYTRKELGKALEMLVEIDRARKSTSVQSDYLLRTLTEKLISL